MTHAADLGVEELLRHGDRALILAQRLTEWITHAPDLEEDLALANLGLDLIGQARALYSIAGRREGLGRDEDDFAYLRNAHEFLHPALVEQPNGDFAVTIVRQFCHDAYALELWTKLADGADTDVGQLAAKVVKETTYHVRYSRGWFVRLGNGTDESHRRMLVAVETMWPFVDGLFNEFEHADFRLNFDARLNDACSEATLTWPTSRSVRTPTNDSPLAPPSLLVELLAEMQGLKRAHPGATW